MVEVVPLVVFGETGKRQVMTLLDLGCNTTLIDKSLVLSLGLQGKEVDLEIYGVKLRGCLLPSTSRNAMSHVSEERKSSTPCEM